MQKQKELVRISAKNPSMRLNDFMAYLGLSRAESVLCFRGRSICAFTEERVLMRNGIVIDQVELELIARNARKYNDIFLIIPAGNA